jgi:hypothetical protein
LLNNLTLRKRLQLSLQKEKEKVKQLLKELKRTKLKMSL